MENQSFYDLLDTVADLRTITHISTDEFAEHLRGRSRDEMRHLLLESRESGDVTHFIAILNSRRFDICTLMLDHIDPGEIRYDTFQSSEVGLDPLGVLASLLEQTPGDSTLRSFVHSLFAKHIHHGREVLNGSNRSVVGYAPWEPGNVSNEAKEVFVTAFIRQLSQKRYCPNEPLRLKIESALQGEPDLSEEYIALREIVSNAYDLFSTFNIYPNQESNEKINYPDLLYPWLDCTNSFVEANEALHAPGAIRFHELAHCTDSFIRYCILPHLLERHTTAYEQLDDESLGQLVYDLRPYAMRMLFDQMDIESVYGFIHQWTRRWPFPNELRPLLRGEWYAFCDNSSFQTTDGRIDATCLTQSSQLNEIGARMRNCLGSHYHGPCLNGSSHIIHFQDAQKHESILEVRIMPSDFITEGGFVYDPVPLTDNQYLFVVQHEAADRGELPPGHRDAAMEWIRQIQSDDIARQTSFRGETEDSKKQRGVGVQNTANLFVGYEINKENIQSAFSFFTQIREDAWKSQQQKWGEKRRRFLFSKQYRKDDDVYGKWFDDHSQEVAQMLECIDSKLQSMTESSEEDDEVCIDEIPFDFSDDEMPEEEDDEYGHNSWELLGEMEEDDARWS